MPTVAELNVAISTDTRGLEAGLAKAEKDVGGFGDSVSKGIGLGAGFGIVSKGIELVGSAMMAAKSSVIDLNSSLEQSKIAFTTMLGSAEKADAFLTDLQKLAAQTPFEFPDLVNASKRMLAFGFESKQVVPLLTAVGDASAAIGGGAETIDGVTMALGQMQAKGKVSAEEMNQLAERGIPAWDMLAKQMGISIPEAMDMASKGAIKAGTFIEAFQKGTAERFGGMMEKQSLTFAGAMSTISDSITMATAKAFKPFFDLLSEGAIAISKLVQSDTFAAWADGISAAIGGVVDATKGMIDVFRGGSSSIEHVRELLNTLFPPEVSAAIIGAIADLGDLFTETFTGNITGALDAVSRILGNFGTIIAGLVEDWAAKFAGWVDGAGGNLLDNLGDLWVGFEDWLQTTGIAIIEKLAVWAAAFVDWVGPKIPDLLRELGALAVRLIAWMVDDALPVMLTKLAEWGLAFVEWVAPRIPPLLLELGKLLLALGGWIITTALPAIGTKLLEWGAAFVDWVAPKIPPLLVELGNLMLEVLGWITNTALPKVVAELIGWGAAFLDWVAKDVIPTLPEKLGAILTAISGWVGEKVSTVAESVKAIGSGILQGIQDGISGALESFWSWLKNNFVDKIPETIRKLLGLDADTGALALVGERMIEELKIGISNAWPSLEELWKRLGGGLGEGGNLPDGVVESYIRSVARRDGLDPDTAVGVWTGEGRSGYVGDHGSSFGPFQLHYGGIAGGGNAVAGMGDDFTRATGLSAMDPSTWMRQVDFALDWASRHGWGAFHGAPASATRGYAAGGWAGLNGPELAWLGERGPEYVVPNSALGGMGDGSMQYVVLDVAIGGSVAERIYITGRDIALRRGRSTAGVGTTGNLLSGTSG